MSSIEGSGFAFENVDNADVSRPERGATRPERPAQTEDQNRGAGFPKDQTESGETGRGKTEGSPSGSQDRESVDRQYQDALKKAAEKGLPVVVVFGSQNALDTEKQTTQTIKQNVKEGEAVYMYVDTDKLDPSSDLGKVARRSEEQGLGLGEDGKADLAFTGIYTVEKKADGSLGLGKSTATFWGGRSEISGIMREQMQYAKRATLSLGGGDTPPQPDSNRPSDNNPDKTNPDRSNPDRPNPDGVPQPPDPDARDDRNPRPGTDSETPDSKKKEDESADARKQREEREAQEKSEKERAEKERKRLEDEERQKQEQQLQQERRKGFQKERLKELAEVGGDKGYTLEQYAEGWGRFLDRMEMEPGPLRDSVNELGKQAFMGEFDGKKLAESMARAGATDQSSVDQALQNMNEHLVMDGLKVAAKVDPASGKIISMEMSTLEEPGKPATTIGVTTAGELVSHETSKENAARPVKKALSFAEASMRLARKAEPAACP